MKIVKKAKIEEPKVETKVEPKVEVVEKKRGRKPKEVTPEVKEEVKVEKKTEYFPQTVKTKKSTFHKTEVKAQEELTLNHYIFAQEGPTPSIFKVAHNKSKIYIVDLTSKGENAESFVNVDFEDILNKNIQGVQIEVYEREED